MVYFLLLLVALAIILVLLQWVMHCQAKRPEGEKAPNTSAIDHQDSHPMKIYYFFSASCGPCRSLSPIVDRLREEHTNLIKVNIAEHAQIARDFGVAGVPSFIVVQDGVIKAVKLGRVSERWLVDWLQEDSENRT